MSDLLIRCAPDLLSSLERRIRNLNCDLISAVNADFSASPPVDGDYDTILVRRWSDKRAEIREGVVNVADVVKSLREAFMSMDRQLAAAVDGSPQESAVTT